MGIRPGWRQAGNPEAHRDRMGASALVDAVALDPEDLLQLLLIGAIGVTGFLIETARIAATRPAIAPASYVSNALAPALFSGMSFQEIVSVHKALWWGHLLMAFAQQLAEARAA